ncbi:lipopolysaccharide assembly protein LapB [Pseudoalteromonas sp. BDTF-M6]|uniref:lipopolysaccharide assembly protein LapB n=1 Tax=Pseudoalteromonas sp. BDTF-M6 TaxID=2796132 RepID=UPI001BAEFB89|nr:lipopolysaccharide assembly protein LapB [Pseudoalteromonas sp. BDTF-M6]MBS3796589.1 lipopolysaccharide assembly protein LapB [Pseudoalteromonas sp. BDTF-M6]
MLELLFLLLPVAAGYGWIMGKNSAKNQAHQHSRKITAEYSKGLKFLLDREDDQGLEHLIQLLEVSADSVEHYLTLATLFRRRGELDRAIKIHELLLEHPNLNDDQLTTCRLELAQDYILAGLLDSAEEHLLILIKQKRPQALEPLITLYSQTREWHKGIALHQRYAHLFTQRQQKIAIANFYCEAGAADNAPELMSQALGVGEPSVRPLYELGQLAFQREDYVQAIHYWRDLICQFTYCSPLVLERLSSSYRHLHLEHQFEHLLAELVDKGGIGLKIHYCQHLVKAGQRKQAVEFITKSLKKQPNIRGFRFLLQLLAGQNAQLDEALNPIDKLIQSYIDTKADFQCQHCGFQSHSHYWLCPSCRHWESMQPSRGLDGF